VALRKCGVTNACLSVPESVPDPARLRHPVARLNEFVVEQDTHIYSETCFGIILVSIKYFI
jgi:hypothetical protein